MKRHLPAINLSCTFDMAREWEYVRGGNKKQKQSEKKRKEKET